MATKHRIGWFIACGMALTVGIVVIGWVAYRMTVPPARASLPWSATAVRDEYVDLGNDYFYVLRADMGPVDFAEYVRKLGLTPHSAKRTYTDDTTWLSWSSFGGKTPWWDPTDDLLLTFVKQDGRAWMYAKYEHGTMYLKSIHH